MHRLSTKTMAHIFTGSKLSSKKWRIVMTTLKKQTKKKYPYPSGVNAGLSWRRISSSFNTRGWVKRSMLSLEGNWEKHALHLSLKTIRREMWTKFVRRLKDWPNFATEREQCVQVFDELIMYRPVFSIFQHRDIEQGRMICSESSYKKNYWKHLLLGHLFD